MFAKTWIKGISISKTLATALGGREEGFKIRFESNEEFPAKQRRKGIKKGIK